ncbi:MAG: DUF937 domain-containing protein [Rhodothermales bacterium]|nr:DUF937 domain-containing protein [Rhodothermales bacterium]
MSGLMDVLASQMSGGVLDQISGQIGADNDATQKAMAAALPALIGGLARNATKSEDGAVALANALDRDHDGGLLDNLSGLLGAGSGGGLASMFGGGKSSGGGLGNLVGMAGALFGDKSNTLNKKSVDGAGILRHVLGGKRNAVETGVSKASGLDASQAAKLLPLLAPIVMSALGRVKKQQNMSPGDLAGMLRTEKEVVARQAPAGMGGLMGLIDSDNDGQIADDLSKLGAVAGGAGLLKKMFGNK